jgi:hypothetical protein
MFLNSTYADIFFETTKTTDNNEKEVIILPAHKMIISTESLFFKGLFDSELNNSGIIDFKIHKSTTIEGLLSFIYRGYVDDLYEIVEDLLPVASMALLPQLVSICEVVLTTQVSCCIMKMVSSSSSSS